MRWIFIPICIGLAPVHSCTKKSPVDSENIHPVYVTIAGHIEDVDIYARCAATK